MTTPLVPPKRSTPLAVQISEQLRDRIGSGQWAVGQKIPSENELVAAFYGKGPTKTPVTWPAYRATYLREMREQRDAIAELGRRVAGGETITLLCSSACERESRCHRSLLRDLIQAQIANQT